MRPALDIDTAFAYPVLIGDIGGTHARFAILVDPYAEPKSFPVVETASFESIDMAIQQGVLDTTSVQPKTAILAVAGPIDSDEIDLTNSPWVVRPKDMLANLGFIDVIVINDFEAQALAAAFIDEDNREKIGGGDIDPHSSRVVLGPGTGLGVAGLVNCRHIWIPVPGEGGHVDMGPRTARDYEIFPHLETIEGRISAEQILCGRGIVNIYRAVCRTGGNETKLADPAEITTAGLDNSDSAAVETVSLFATYLGRIAGDLALVFMARGGVFLAGGISKKILPALHRPEFRASFEDKAPHNAMIRSMPTFVITHPLAALAGLGAYARTPARFGVSTEGRRWKT